MTKPVHRVSTWKNPDSPVHHPEPAKLNIGEEWAVIEVNPMDWPDDLDRDAVIGWPVVASKKTEDGCTTLYEGEIREVATKARMSGLVRRLKCKPATDPQSQFVPGAYQP